MRTKVRNYLKVLDVALSFNGVSWWLIDLKTDPGIYHCNEQMCNTFALDASQAGHSVRDTCPIAGDYLKYVKCESRADADRIFSDYKRLLNREIDEYDNVFPYFDARSSITRHFLSRAKALTFDHEGRIEMLFGIVEDVSEQVTERHLLEAERERFKTLSERDALTRLYNRRQFDKVYEHECARAAREHSQLGLLIIDVDCFKQYNDHYGHAQGDTCLVQLADAFRRTVNSATDTVFRMGGEEFVVLSTRCNEEGMHDLAQRLCQCVRDLRIAHEHSTAADWVTISIGAVVGRVDADRKSQTTHLQQADENLYMIKQNGRDDVRTLDMDCDHDALPQLGQVC